MSDISIKELFTKNVLGKDNENTYVKSKYGGQPALTNVSPSGGLPRPPDDKIIALKKALDQLNELHAELEQKQTEIQSLTILLGIIFDDKADAKIVRRIIQAILNPPYKTRNDYYCQIVQTIKMEENI